MNSSVQRHLQLILSFIDKGFDTGTRRSKMRIDDIKKAAQQAALIIAALVGAFTGATIALYKFIEAGAKIRDVETTFEDVRAKAGLLPSVMKQIVEATRGVVTNIDIMRASTRALADGLDPERIVEFWAKAKQISEVTGTPVVDVFNMLYLAIAKGQTRMLTSIGITLDAEEAVRKYATSIGKTTAELSFRDRQMAISMALEEKYLKQFKALGEQGDDNAERFRRFGVQVKNLKDKFLGMLADSPSVEKFMNFMLEKMEGWASALDRAEPKIQAVVERLTEFYETIATFIDERAEPAIQWVSRYKEELLGLAAALITFSTLSKFGVPPQIAGGIGLGVGLGTFIGAEASGFEAELDRYHRALAKQAIPEFDKLAAAAKQAGIDISQYTNEGLRELLGMIERMQGMVPPGGIKLVEEPVFPGDKPKDADVWQRGPGARPGPDYAAMEEYAITHELAAQQIPKFLEQQEQLEEESRLRRISAEWEYDQKLRSIREARSSWEIDLLVAEINAEIRGMNMIRGATEQGYAAMGKYSRKFYDDAARRSRTFNAMMIVGFGETVAAYIESRTKEARADMLYAAYKALMAVAAGNWHAAWLWTQAAAGAAKMGVGGALLAGAIRYWSQEKAESISAQQEQEWQSQTAEGGGTAAQRKRATGIVNTRPIAINVYSTANFNAGYMIFGDSESAARDVYGDCFRDKIAEDIESGVIAIPA